MGKATISMAIFNSYVKLPEGKLASSEVRDTLEVDEFFKSLASNSIAMPPFLWNPVGSPQQTWSISDKHDQRT